MSTIKKESAVNGTTNQQNILPMYYEIQYTGSVLVEARHLFDAAEKFKKGQVKHVGAVTDIRVYNRLLGAVETHLPEPLNAALVQVDW